MLELLTRIRCKLYYINHNYEIINREIVEDVFSDHKTEIIEYKCKYCGKRKKVDICGNKYTLDFN